MMKHVTSILTALFFLSFMNVVLGQSEKPPKAQWIEEEVQGFILVGGTVNAIEGEVTGGGNSAELRPLKTKQQLVNGEEVTAAETGRAEILLNPGYYLRLSPNTRVA